MRENELQRCINKYFYSSPLGTSKLYYSKLHNDVVDKILDGIQNDLVLIDHPDGYMRIDDTIVLIEHFEYDSTKHTRKGSETRQQEAQISREIEEKSTKNGFITRTMDVTHSMDNLVNNFVKTFSKHNAEIDSYIENLRNDGVILENDVIKILFMIEDVSSFGLLYLNQEHSMSALNIFQVKECLDAVIDSKVDYFMLFNTYQNDKTIRFRSKEELASLYAKSKNKDEYDLIDWTPNVIGYSIELPI